MGIRRNVRIQDASISVERLENRELLTADSVTAWNELLLDAIRSEHPAPPVASRAMAIVSTAIFDAVNSIDRSYEPYLVQVPGGAGASIDAAVASAAHRTLVTLFPARAADFNAALTASLAAIKDGPAESKGVQIGISVAEQILASRSADGSSATVTYTPGINPGEWRPTPSGFQQAVLPQWPDVTPFALTSGSQFLSPAPPALTSAEYAADLAQVQELGSLTSTTRTTDQADIAKFWAGSPGTATPPGEWNMVAQAVVQTHVTTTAENARLFALLNVALADAGIAAWDAKYHFNLWRPITAIREADTDGNTATVQDGSWTPLLNTPAFSGFVSGHSTFSGAAAAVLKSFFGTDNVAFVLPSEVAGVADRSFTSFSSAAEEAGISRIYGGIHFNFDNTDGLTLGDNIGDFVTSTILRPVVRVNAGGPELTTELFFNTDRTFQTGGLRYRTNAEIDMSLVATDLPSQLFQTVRFDAPRKGNLQYRIPAKIGATYRVDLYFSEIWSGAFRPNARKFDIAIDGHVRINDLDVFAEAGANTALVKSLEVVSDGILNIELLRKIQNPAIAGIQITELSAPSPSNTAPTISDVADQTINENTATASLAFTVNDADGDPLTVTATSSNLALLPISRIVIAGTGANRRVTATPVAGRFGTAVVTLQVSDGKAIATDQFTLTVNEVIVSNRPPVISAVADQVMNAGTTIAIPFVVTDPENNRLTVTAAAADRSMLTRVSVTGTGKNRTLKLTAGAALGETDVTLTVSDGTNTVTKTFHVTASLRLNGGGPTIAASPAFVSEKLYRNVGNNFRTSRPIDVSSVPAGIPAAVFQTVLFDWRGGPEMEFDIPLEAGGNYRVDLLFSEIWSGAFGVGKRVFDVKLDGALKLDKLDIFAEAGANKGLIKSFDITSDGNLDIDLFHVVQSPAIAGIQITRLD